MIRNKYLENIDNRGNTLPIIHDKQYLSDFRQGDYVSLVSVVIENLNKPSGYLKINNTVYAMMEELETIDDKASWFNQFKPKIQIEFSGTYWILWFDDSNDKTIVSATGNVAKIFGLYQNISNKDCENESDKVLNVEYIDQYDNHTNHRYYIDKYQTPDFESLHTYLSKSLCIELKQEFVLEDGFLTFTHYGEDIDIKPASYIFSSNNDEVCEFLGCYKGEEYPQTNWPGHKE